MRRRTLLGSAAAAALAPGVGRAQATGIKVAFVATLSGPGAAIGNQLRDGWLAGVKHLDGKLGGVPVETLVIDDELKPDVAVTKVGGALERGQSRLCRRRCVQQRFAGDIPAGHRERHILDFRECRSIDIRRQGLQSALVL